MESFEDLLKKVNEEIQKTPRTVFDDFSIRINRKSVGKGLRDDLGEEFNSFGRINELASYAEFKAKQAKAKKDKVLSVALDRIEMQNAGKRMSIEAKKNAARILEVRIDGETTSVIEQEIQCALYEYIASRGKDKIREMSSMLDLGRSMLSFDKSEIDRNG